MRSGGIKKVLSYFDESLGSLGRAKGRGGVYHSVDVWESLWELPRCNVGNIDALKIVSVRGVTLFE